MPFEPNLGQTAAPVSFLSHGPGFGLFLTNTSAVFSLARPNQPDTHDVVQLTMTGANATP